MKIVKATKQDPNSLTQRVYKDLRLAIITGKITGGSRLVESTLAAQMQVSRTPVREALHKLALEGLLYSIPRAGYIVEEMSDEDVQDLFTTRMAIEQLAARQALEKITTEELDRMKLNLEQTDAALAVGRTDKMTELDIAFHGILYKATRSKTLYHICRTLSDHSLKYRMALIHLPEIAKKTRDGHYRIFEALRSGVAEEVDAAIESHLQLAKKDIKLLLEQQRQEAFIAEDLIP